jgi:hypothetical protein
MSWEKGETGREARTRSRDRRDEQWKELCEAILREPDRNRMMELVTMLNRALEENERLANGRARGLMPPS